MNNFKKRQMVIIAIFVVVALVILWPRSTRCDGIFGFVSYAHDSVKVGRSSFAIAADGTVESATFEIAGGKGFQGTGFGSAIYDKGIGGNLFYESKSATYQLVYEKGMDAPEERESQTSAYSWLIRLEDLELAAEALVERFRGQDMMVNFSASGNVTNEREVLLSGYDGFFHFDINTWALKELPENTPYVIKDHLTVYVGGKVYMVVF